MRSWLSFIPPLMTALALVVAPSVGAPASRLEPFGLDGRVVTSLGAYGSLYAGTIGDGVFRLDPGDSLSSWTPLGLPGKRIRAVYPHPSGPIGFATTAGLEGDPLNPDSALVYCSELDQPPWVVTDSGMTRIDIGAVWSLDGFPSPAICGETFAATIGSAGGVWRRRYDSDVWEFVLDMGFGVGNVVRADPSSGNVWAGGETTVMAPWIARSTDRGDTWQVRYPDLAGDNACNAIAVHPDDPNVAYAGMEGPVIKTTDGGATWEETGLGATPAYIFGVALDSESPSHILAGGMIRNPNNWALWESFDDGDTWVEIPAPASLPGASGISSIIADLVRPGTFYIATFGHGVWRYRSTLVDVGDRPFPGIVLAQNYPNPSSSGTTFRFEIPSSLDGTLVRLAIYGMRGDLVRVLVDDVRHAGVHRVSWNGEHASGRIAVPGVYYGRLQVGPYRQTRKVNLLK